MSYGVEETIYNLIPQPEERIEKPPRYRSQYDPNGPLVGSTFSGNPSGTNLVRRNDHSTFGAPNGTNKAQPEYFLTKGAKISRKTLPPGRPKASMKFKEDINKAPIPRKTERPIMGLKSNKNFITANAVDTILKVPKQVDLDDPNFLHKDDYGKVPEYLAKVKDEVARENEMIDEFLREQLGTDGPSMSGGLSGVENMNVDVLSEGERRDLIENLKSKWDELNRRYQRLCHHTKTEGGQKRRKEALEREMAQVEADVMLLEKGRNGGEIHILKDY